MAEHEDKTEKLSEQELDDVTGGYRHRAYENTDNGMPVSKGQASDPKMPKQGWASPDGGQKYC